MAKECLQDAPSERPATEELLTRLQGMRVEIDREYGSNFTQLDTEKLKLVKEVNAKERRIDKLMQQQVHKNGKQLNINYDSPFLLLAREKG